MIHRNKILSLIALFGFLAAFSLTRGDDAPARPAIDFVRDVQPIFAANCYECHGPQKSKGALRLDARPLAINGGSSKHAIVPGSTDKSVLIHRVLGEGDEERMPLKHAPLTAAQIATLRAWIDQGANWPESASVAGATLHTHWSFIKPVRSEPPAAKNKAWPRNPIDNFVLAALEKDVLEPSPEADRYALIRRVSLDLIGLPPTPEEADAFAKDESPDAYEKLVDRLLANPHYGERWARRWLDLARYADTNGFEKDRPRTIWPYRDWVIDALNKDMPFDQFTVEQLAGDMLPNATPSQKIATGFHRNTMLNEEGGIDPLEYRFLATVDRINTTGTAWLGLTVGCAQCHTHKYDPISHKEYYRLMAFLNNADEPQMEIPSADAMARRKEIEAKIAKLTARLPERYQSEEVVDWETPTAVVTTANGSIPGAEEDGAWTFTGPSPETDTYTFEFDSGTQAVDRIRLQTLKNGDTGPGRTPHGNFVLTEITASVAPKDAPDKAQGVKFVRAQADFSQGGFPVEDAIDGNAATGWAVDPGGGTRITERAATFYLEKPMAFPKGARWKVKLDQQYGRQHTIGKLRLGIGSITPEPADGRSLEVHRREAFEKALAKWEAQESKKAVKWTVLRPVDMQSSKPFLTLLEDGSVLAGGDVAKSVTYDLTFRPELRGVTAVRLEALPDESLPGRGPGMIYYEGQPGDFFLSEISLQGDGQPLKFAKVAQSDGSSAAMAIDGDPQTGWSIGNGQGRAHTAIFSLAAPTEVAKELKLHMLFERYFAAPLGHFRISVTNDPQAAGATEVRPAEVEEALATPADQRSAEQRDVLLRQFESVTTPLTWPRKEIDDLRNGMPKPTTTLVMRERPAGHPRPTFLQHRGEFLQPKEELQPGVPAFLPPLPAEAQANRLSFARWLVSPENPLTARVQVNRQWAAFFGRGIVRTQQDFGTQGELPSNQPLLDWLATEFMRDGWSMKKLDRLIVTSATYRQSSRVSPELLARDPDNTLLARGPRFRLEAELIRDGALKASGLLSEKIGGPSVFPSQPASITTEATYGALAWNTSKGEDRYRRSLYTYSKRTAPYALFSTFDAPSGEACVARREVSDSPLQALSLLNDTVFVETAQALGRVIAASQESDEARAAQVFRRCLTRPPEKEELALLVQFAHDQRGRFGKKELDAEKVAGPGKAGDADAVERATWTTVARSVMNLDEAVTKD
ncbi:MAG TPA: PSD1 and planctomycete cytochrome C domain-containing protein [Tepidisphaeraceae bacterium]|nr:PSD1 and planctomycete cytochrome C domain-containing protein [Tepidisphaeraceae bacterium]